MISLTLPLPSVLNYVNDNVLPFKKEHSNMRKHSYPFSCCSGKCSVKIALRLYYLRLQGFSYSAVTGEEKIPLCMTIKLFKLFYKIYNMQDIYLLMYQHRNSQKGSEIQDPHSVSLSGSQRGPEERDWEKALIFISGPVTHPATGSILKFPFRM